MVIVKNLHPTITHWVQFLLFHREIFHNATWNPGKTKIIKKICELWYEVYTIVIHNNKILLSVFLQFIKTEKMEYYENYFQMHCYWSAALCWLILSNVILSKISWKIFSHSLRLQYLKATNFRVNQILQVSRALVDFA